MAACTGRFAGSKNSCLSINRSTARTTVLRYIEVFSAISLKPAVVSFSPHSLNEMDPCARSFRSLTTKANGPRLSLNIRFAATLTAGVSLSRKPTRWNISSILVSLQFPPPPFSSLNSGRGSALTSKSAIATAYFNRFSAFSSLLAATTTFTHSFRKCGLRSAAFHAPFQDAEASASKQRVIIASIKLYSCTKTPALKI